MVLGEIRALFRDRSVCRCTHKIEQDSGTVGSGIFPAKTESLRVWIWCT